VAPYIIGTFFSTIFPQLLPSEKQGTDHGFSVAKKAAVACWSVRSSSELIRGAHLFLSAERR